MDMDALAPLIALTKRAADSSATAPGQNLIGLGAATAGAGFGGEALANRYLSQRPIQSTAHDLSSFMRNFSPNSSKPQVSKMDIAKGFSQHGRGAGKIGLGILGAGIPTLMMGRRLDAVRGETSGLKEQIAQLLASHGAPKQALDFEAIRARMQKTAGLPGAGSAFKWGSKMLGMGGQAAHAAAPMAHAAAPMAHTAQQAIPYASEVASRAFNPARAAKMVGGLGAAGGTGAVALGHAQDNAANSTEWHTSNPLTWFGGHSSPEEVYSRNYGKFKDMAGGLDSQITDAYGKGDFDQAGKLQQQMQSGNFGGGGAWYEPWKWRMGGLNPFTDQRASYYQQHALGAQQGMQGQYNTELGKTGPQPGDQQRLSQLQQAMNNPNMLPNQADAIQRQMQALQQRMGQTAGTENDAAKAIRERMQATGMRWMPSKPGQPGQPSPAGSYPPGESRPQPGGRQGYGVNPNDHKRMQAYDPWEDDAMQRPLGGR